MKKRKKKQQKSATILSSENVFTEYCAVLQSDKNKFKTKNHFFWRLKTLQGVEGPIFTAVPSNSLTEKQ